jgi:hypothetical protein
MADQSIDPMLTYEGLVDDFAQNHGDACIKTLEQLNDHLISAVLTGDPLLINDGHIIMNPAIREAVIDPTKSPLQSLIRTGYVRILTRNGGDIETLADQMADEGITSAQKLGTQDYYRKEYLPALHSWMSELRRAQLRDFLYPWPPINTSSVFHRVSAAAYRTIRKTLRAEHLREELEALRRFIDLYESGERQRRTDWENIVNKLKGEKRLSERLYRELMHAANEAYQYSWGVVLARNDNLVRVETRAPKHTSLDVAIGTAGGAEDIAKRTPVEVYRPNLKVANRKIGQKWERLAEVARQGSSTYYAKVEFQRCLEDYYRGNESDTDKVQMEAAAREYSRSLSELFRDAERAKTVYDYATAVGGWAAGIPIASLTLSGHVVDGIGLAVAVAPVIAGQFGAPQGMIKILGRDSQKWIANEALGIRPTMVSNFQIDRQAADKYREGIPEFKPA